MKKNISFAFFGTGALAESVLASLVRNGYTPSLIITKPDSLQGRHLQLTPPHIKVWAEMKGIPVSQPQKLDNTFYQELRIKNFDLFIVGSYGKIIPDNIVNMPKYGTLNIHPSLLPKYRGPSPIESALLNGETMLGVSIMKLDAEMDHGPILVQTAFPIDAEATSGTLEVTCGQFGGDLLVQVLEPYINGTLIPKEQDHSKATFCKKMTKEIGEIKITDEAKDVRIAFRALSPWPGLYFFIEHKGKQIRVKITDVDMFIPVANGDTTKDVVTSVIPEGKKEMSWESFENGYLK